VLKKSVSSSTLLSTIEFPKDKSQFSVVLPSPKYESFKESASEVFPDKRPASGVKENVLSRYLKPESSLLTKKKKLSNAVYYAERPNHEIREIRSEKLLAEPSIEKRVSTEKNEEKAGPDKNRSFKEILRSL
jgi:hypothetical protein